MAESRLQQWKSLVYVLEKSSTVHVHVNVDLFHHLGGPPTRPMSFRWTSDHQSPNSKAGVVAEQSRARRSERTTLNAIFLDQKDDDVCN
jgi:hypothetical protein